MTQAKRLHGRKHRTLAERQKRRRIVARAIDNAILTLLCLFLTAVSILYINAF